MPPFEYCHQIVDNCNLRSNINSVPSVLFSPSPRSLSVVRGGRTHITMTLNVSMTWDSGWGPTQEAGVCTLHHVDELCQGACKCNTKMSSDTVVVCELIWAVLLYCRLLDFTNRRGHVARIKAITVCAKIEYPTRSRWGPPAMLQIYAVLPSMCTHARYDALEAVQVVFMIV